MNFGAYHYGNYTVYTELPVDYYANPDPVLPRIQFGSVALVYFPPR